MFIFSIHHKRHISNDTKKCKQNTAKITRKQFCLKQETKPVKCQELDTLQVYVQLFTICIPEEAYPIS